jgi:hypothetical protein
MGKFKQSSATWRVVHMPTHSKASGEALLAQWGLHLRIAPSLSARLRFPARQPHDRASRRAFKLRGKLGAEGGIGGYIPKPKWMRQLTFDRKLKEIFAAEEVVEAHMEIFNRKLDRLLGR